LALKGGHTDCAAIIKTAQAVLESTRLETFSSLLEACLQGNYDAMQQLLRGLKEDLLLVINMTPEGSNTLLFKYGIEFTSLIVPYFPTDDVS